MARTAADPPVIVEVDASAPHSGSLNELWKFRDLFLVMGLRDIKVRYRQTVVGVAWLLLQPILLLAVLAPIFGPATRAGDDAGAPYWALFLTGFLPWQFFSSFVSISAASLVAQQHLIGKVYFPRFLVPCVPVVVTGLDFLMSTALLLTVVGIWRGLPATVWLVPVFAVWLILLAIIIGVGLSALNALYRDVSSIIPFALQLAFFCSPIAYTLSYPDVSWDFRYLCNPLAVVIQGFRWGILAEAAPRLEHVGAAILWTVSAAGASWWYFNRVESRLSEAM